MRVICELIFVFVVISAVVKTTVNAVGISSKLDFDDDSERVPDVTHEKIQSHDVSLITGPQFTNVKNTKSEFVIEDFFHENIKNDKIQQFIPTAAVKCDSTRELCEITAGEKVSKDDDIVLTNVNVKVVTKHHNNGNDNSNVKSIKGVGDVPILQESQGHTFGITQNNNNNVPLKVPNTPIIQGNGYSSTRNSGFVPIIPIEDPSYNNRHFGENPPPNSIWTSRNINTNPQNPKGFYNGFNKRIYETTNQKRPSVLNTNTWFYPINNPVIPTRPTPTDYNNNHHDISSLLAPPTEKHYPGNLFTNINYPESTVPLHYNHPSTGESVLCNCVRDHSGRSHAQPFRTSFVDQTKKIKGIDDKLDELN